jgi:hypothetical protein
MTKSSQSDFSKIVVQKSASHHHHEKWHFINNRLPLTQSSPTLQAILPLETIPGNIRLGLFYLANKNP